MIGAIALKERCLLPLRFAFAHSSPSQSYIKNAKTSVTNFDYLFSGFARRFAFHGKESSLPLDTSYARYPIPALRFKERDSSLSLGNLRFLILSLNNVSRVPNQACLPAKAGSVNLDYLFSGFARSHQKNFESMCSTAPSLCFGAI